MVSEQQIYEILEAAAFFRWVIDENGCTDPRPLPGRRYACIKQFAFTHAILLGCIEDYVGYDDRWCYSSYGDAKRALEAWDGSGEPTGWSRHPLSGRRISRSADERTTEAGPLGRSAWSISITD